MESAPPDAATPPPDTRASSVDPPLVDGDASSPHGDAGVDLGRGSGPCAPAGSTRACTGVADGGSPCSGLQRCLSGSGEFGRPAWGACECDVVEVSVDIAGDCVRASCPPTAPYPVGCQLDFQGGDPRGCVAHGSTPSELFFKEGNRCDQGRVLGKLFCSSITAASLDAKSCPINKPEPHYPASSKDCPG